MLGNGYKAKEYAQEQTLKRKGDVNHIHIHPVDQHLDHPVNQHVQQIGGRHIKKINILVNYKRNFFKKRLGSSLFSSVWWNRRERCKNGVE